MKLDLNCDLGEGEPSSRTQALMQWASSVNIACGGHAGDAQSMQCCVAMAKRLGVRVGAHPGPWSRQDRGRRAVHISPADLELLLLHQVGAFAAIARQVDVRLHHIKLHGALYHATESHPRLGARYLETVRRCWPGTIVYARANGALARTARALGMSVWEEAFADRGYEPNGELVPRGHPGALLTAGPMIEARVRRLLVDHEIVAVDGTRLSIYPKTICVHSDTPNSTRLAKMIVGLLE